MNKKELDKSLDFISKPSGELEIVLYACLHENKIKKLDIKNSDLPPIIGLFVNSIKNLIIEKKEFSVKPLSTADERNNCFYEYDLELPEELKAFEKVSENTQIENFNILTEKFKDITALIVVLADNKNKISIYKKLSPIEIIGQGGYMLWKSCQRLELFNEQLLRISGNFQVVKIDKNIIIIDLSSIEKSFGFHDVIIREAAKGLDTIKNMEIVSNIETLEELISNVSFARKLTKIAHDSPVIKKGITNANIITFSKNHPAIKNKIRYSDNGTQFLLDTKVSKDLFIKILNDDYLTSDLTSLYYESLAKDNIEATDDEEINN